MFTASKCEIEPEIAKIQQDTSSLESSYLQLG